MGSTDYGTQLITFQYNQPATSGTFNRLLYDTLPPGIYDGMYLSKPEPTLNRVAISTGTVVLHDPNYTEITDDSIPELLVDGVAVKVQTTSSVTDLDLTTTKPYVVINYVWQNVTDNYANIETKAWGDVDETQDVIIGRGSFVSGVLQDTFDYTRRTVPPQVHDREKRGELQVLFNEGGAENKVKVTSGSAVVNNVRVEWGGGPSPIFNDTPSTERRRDILYLKSDGDLQISYGTPTTGTPQPPDYPKQGIVLAEISRNADRDTVNGNEIIPIDPRYHVSNNLSWGTGSMEVDSREIPLGTSVNQTVSGGVDFNIAADTNIRDAVNTLVQQMYDASGIANNTITERHIDWGTGGNEVSAVNVPIADSDGYLSATDVENAISEMYIEFSTATSINDDTIKDYHIDWGTGSNQVSAVDVPVEDSSGNLSATDVENALAEIYGKAASIENNEIKDYHIDWGTGSNEVNAADIPIVSFSGGSSVEGALDHLDSNKLENTGDTLDGILQVNDSITCSTFTTAQGTQIAYIHMDDSDSYSAFNNRHTKTQGIVIYHPTVVYLYLDTQSGFYDYAEAAIEAYQNNAWGIMKILVAHSGGLELYEKGIMLLPGYYRLRVTWTGDGALSDDVKGRVYKTGVFGETSL